MILVTGASGLVGLHLIQALSQGNIKIRAVYRSHIPKVLSQTNSDMIEWFQADILDFPALQNAFIEITHVYHTAAIVSYDERLLETMMNINVEGTANVVNLCLHHKIEKLIHVSSVSCIGEGQKNNFKNESLDFDENEANSNYGKSKYLSELEVWRGIAEGLQAAIVNPAIILGEGDWSRSSSNLFKIVNNEFPFYTKGVTAWVDVKDVVKAMLSLMNSEISSQRFILSSENLAFKEVFTFMANALHKKPPSIYAAPWLSEIVWRLSYLKSKLTGKIATLTKETARSAHQINNYSNEKFLKAFPDFKFEKIEKTVKRICG